MPSKRKQPATELDVQRINIVDPDGTVRLVISNRDLTPGAVIGGRTYPRKGMGSAGLIFYNDEGVECGAIRFAGRQLENGHRTEAGLVFDQYEQDEILGLTATDFNGRRNYGLHVWDRPETPLSEAVDRLVSVGQMPDGPAKQEAAQQLQAEGLLGTHRMFVGRNPDGEPVVLLKDSKGRTRIRLLVDKNDQPRMEFLDEHGQVTFQLPPG